MRKTALALAITCLFILPFPAQAGEVSDADKAALKQVALDYVDGFYSSSVERLEKALHPNLQKVTLHKLPNGKAMLDFNGVACNLKEYAAAGLGGKPAGERKIEVSILDVYGDIATIRIDSADFLDYVHAVRIDGQWKIINVLWAPHPRTPSGPAEKQ